MTDEMRLALLAGGILFALFLTSKLLPLTLRRLTPAEREAAQRMLALKQQARSAELPAPERATLLRSAANIALSELGRPGLAASLARRADRLDPAQPETVQLMAVALREQSRFAALERMLWRKLADSPSPAVMKGARQELERLYDGPLKRPEVAAALRRLS